MSINVPTDEVIQVSCLRHSLQAAVRLVALVEGDLQVANGCIVGEE